MTPEWVFVLIPGPLATLYALGGRRWKAIRRFGGLIILVGVMLVFLTGIRKAIGIGVSLSYVLATSLGYGESSKLVKLVKNRVLAFGIVGGVHALGPLVLNHTLVVAAFLLPVLFMASGAASLRWDKFEWSFVEMLWGLSIGVAWSWAIRMNLSG